ARGDQDVVAFEGRVPDADGAGVDERRLAGVSREARVLGGPDPLLRRLPERLLPRVHPIQVDPRGADLDPDPRRERLDVVRELGHDEVGLRRRAGDVWAAAAPALLLDERDTGVVVA